MFKKTTVTQAARPLNGKDVKLLRVDLQEAFPNLQVDQVMVGPIPSPLAATKTCSCPTLPLVADALAATQLDELLPPKAVVNITRLSNRSSVYSVASDVGVPGPPLFFEFDYGGIYPTVYSLWRVPDICALRIATYSEVSSKVRLALL